jgi:hypothetical protein
VLATVVTTCPPEEIICVGQLRFDLEIVEADLLSLRTGTLTAIEHRLDEDVRVAALARTADDADDLHGFTPSMSAS